ILKQTNIKTFEKTLKREGFDKEKLLFTDDLESTSSSDSSSEKNDETTNNNNEINQIDEQDYNWNPEDLLMADDD
ncbi:15804_t:CDS:2, partial [Dentiscutata heterogama]